MGHKFLPLTRWRECLVQETGDVACLPTQAFLSLIFFFCACKKVKRIIVDQEVVKLKYFAVVIN